MKESNSIAIKTLTKSNVWELQENDVFRLIETAEKDAELKDNLQHFITIFKTAFEMEEIKIDRPEVVKKYEARGFKTGSIKINSTTKQKWAIKKKAIMRVTDLTYENIKHITATKLLEVIDRNFGGGWDSLSQNTKDIIEYGFDISTTTLPQNRLRNPEGIYMIKVNDGFEVLEIPKGLWVEAIFAKAKPEPEIIKTSNTDTIKHKSNVIDDEEDDDEDLEDIIDNNDDNNDDDDTFDEDKLTEESYRTTFDTDDDDLNLEDADMGDHEDDY